MKHLLIIFSLLLTSVSWSEDVDYNDLVKRDYQAGGKGVGPGDLFLVTLLKDTYKGGKGDVQIKAKDETGVIIAGGKEIEIKATGAQLSVFSRSDTFSNNFYPFIFFIMYFFFTNTGLQRNLIRMISRKIRCINIYFFYNTWFSKL